MASYYVLVLVRGSKCGKFKLGSFILRTLTIRRVAASGLGGGGSESASEEVEPIAVPVLILAARMSAAAAASVTAVSGEVLGETVVVRVESGGRGRESVVEGSG